MRYLVSWHVEVEAEDPVDAALAVAARPRYLRNAAFTVLDRSSGQTFEVDLHDDPNPETLDDPYKTCEYGHHMYRLVGHDDDGEPLYRCEDCGDTDPEGSAVTRG